MRLVLVAAGVMALVFGSGAQAVELRSPVPNQLYTCAQGVSRVSLQAPAPCCEGQLKCAQFLSTTAVLKTMRDPRT